MHSLKDIFVYSRYVDSETFSDVFSRIRDWLEVEGNDVEDRYIQDQIKYFKMIAERNIKEKGKEYFSMVKI